MRGCQALSLVDMDCLDMEALPETLSLVINEWCQSLDQLTLCTFTKYLLTTQGGTTLLVNYSFKLKIVLYGRGTAGLVNSTKD